MRMNGLLIAVLLVVTHHGGCIHLPICTEPNNSPIDDVLYKVTAIVQSVPSDSSADNIQRLLTALISMYTRTDMWNGLSTYVQCETGAALANQYQPPIVDLVQGVNLTMNSINLINTTSHLPEYITRLGSLFDLISTRNSLFINSMPPPMYVSVQYYQHMVTTHLVIGSELIALTKQKSWLLTFQSLYQKYVDYASIATPKVVSWRSSLIEIKQCCHKHTASPNPFNHTASATDDVCASSMIQSVSTDHPDRCPDTPIDDSHGFPKCPNVAQQGDGIHIEAYEYCSYTDKQSNFYCYNKCDTNQKTCDDKFRNTACQPYKWSVEQRVQRVLTPPLAKWKTLYDATLKLPITN